MVLLHQVQIVATPLETSQVVAWTVSVPFRIPINQTLAILFPELVTCLQCKAAAGVPVSAAGPISLAPTRSPGASPNLSPKGSNAPEPTPSAEAPESDTTPVLTPPSSTVAPEAPIASTTGSRPVLTRSAANASYSFSAIFLELTLGFVIFKNY